MMTIHVVSCTHSGFTHITFLYTLLTIRTTIEFAYPPGTRSDQKFVFLMLIKTALSEPWGLYCFYITNPFASWCLTYWVGSYSLQLQASEQHFISSLPSFLFFNRGCDSVWQWQGSGHSDLPSGSAPLWPGASSEESGDTSGGWMAAWSPWPLLFSP